MGASIKGIQKTSVVDYPPYITSTIFISTCNFRCPFCHNKLLVEDSKTIQEIEEEDILGFLDQREKLVDAVCITGGEPTLYPNLKGFIKSLKEKKIKVKLDTNGTNPDILKDLIKDKLIDYIAMDIKSTKEKYEKAAGAKVNQEKLQESIDLIIKSGKEKKIDYEFRTTVLPEFFDENDAKTIGEWLKGSKRYALQQFTVSGETLDKSFMKTKPYDIKELEKLKSILEPYFDEVILRA